MAETRILSGKVVSDAVYTALKSRIQSLQESSVVPGLAAVIVGEDTSIAVAPVVVTIKSINEIKLILQDKIYEALYEISSDDRSVAKNNESNKTTATPKNKSMGR